MKPGATDESIPSWCDSALCMPVAALADYAALEEVQDVSGVRREDQFFREFAENLPLFLWIADGPGHKVFCNRRYLNFVGISSPNGMDSSWHHAVHPDDREETFQAWLEAVATGKPYEQEYRLRRHDGVYRQVLARALPMRDTAGVIVRWLGTSTDIHELKQAEVALVQAEKLSTAARFASSMAHQINNPLASVTNAIYLAQQDASLVGAPRDYIELASRELARVSHVMKRTLAFHHQSTAACLSNLADLMGEVLGFFAPRLAEAGLTVRREYDVVPDVRCFADDVRQVFVHLVSNALHASSEGGLVRVRIRVAREQASGRRGVQVAIADSGKGIPGEIKARIFTPFVSTKGATSNGLGLWSCYEAAKKHGGSIRFRTSTAVTRHGSVFAFFLPCDQMDCR